MDTLEITDRAAGYLAHVKGDARDEAQSPEWLAGYDDFTGEFAEDEPGFDTDDEVNHPYHDVLGQLAEMLNASFRTIDLRESTWLFTGAFTGLRFESLVTIDAPNVGEIVSYLVDKAGEIEFKVGRHFVASLSVERAGDDRVSFDLITAQDEVAA